MSTRAVSTAVVTAVIALAAVSAASCSQTKEATKEAASSATSIGSSAASAASSAVSGAPDSATGMTTLYYPQQQGALFSIEAPASWKVGTIDQVGDFGSVESENGAILQFRAQTYDTDAQANQEIDAIADSTTNFLKDTYTDITLDDPAEVTINGRPGVQLAGNGKDKDGNAVKFVSAMIFLGPTSIAEIWAAVLPEGNNDLEVATQVLNSFTPLGTP
ncbi:MAG: hypothetical protein ACKOB8_11850 [Mycobacterium sp.]